jgi:hypothetical protein
VAGQNLTSEGGLFSLSLTTQGLFAYINSNPPQCYFSAINFINENISYVQFLNASLAFFNPSDFSFLGYLIPSTLFSNNQYMRFGPDGHLRVYTTNWVEVYDLFARSIGSCVVVLQPQMEQTIFRQSITCCLTVDAP